MAKSISINSEIRYPIVLYIYRMRMTEVHVSSNLLNIKLHFHSRIDSEIVDWRRACTHEMENEIEILYVHV